MANSFTANLNLELPEVGADSNLWGGHLNSDLTILDSIFTSATTRPISSIIKSDTKIVDSATTTKGILFSLTGINTTTTRTVTWKDSDGTVAFTADIATATTGLITTGVVAAATVGMVDTSSVQTLTNKTLTAPILTGIASASTATTQSAGDNSTKLATTAYVDNNLIQIVETAVTGVSASPYSGTYSSSATTAPTSSNGAALSAFDTTFTPKSANSKLVVLVDIRGAGSPDVFTLALFNNTTLIDHALYSTNGNGQNFTFTTVMTPGSTSAIAFKLRVGANSGTGFSLNSINTGAGFGGRSGCISRLVIQEILPHA